MMGAIDKRLVEYRLDTAKELIAKVDRATAAVMLVDKQARKDFGAYVEVLPRIADAIKALDKVKNAAQDFIAEHGKGK